jgi:hypothetical protein
MRDTRTEQFLRLQGVEYVYLEGIVLNPKEARQVDVEAGLRNQARPVPINNGLAEDYALRILEGEYPPAPIFRKNSHELFVPCDGNHRLAAMLMAECLVTDGYVIAATDPALVDAVTLGANRYLEGMRKNADDTVADALKWAKKHGRTLTEAAKRFALKEKTLRRQHQFIEIGERVKTAAPERAEAVISGLAQTAVIKLGPIDNHRVLAAITAIVNETRNNSLSERLIGEIVAHVKGAHTEAEQLARVDEVREWPEVKELLAIGAKVGPPVRTNRTRLITALNQARNILRKEEPLQLFGPQDVSLITTTVNQIIDLWKARSSAVQQ